MGKSQRALRLLLVCTICCASKAAFTGDVIVPQSGDIRIDVRDLKRHVTTLASDSFEGREAGARGGKAALAYLRNELRLIRKTSSLPSEATQDFGRDYQNLLIFLPGSDERLKDEIVIVGAHYDHVGYGNAKNSAGPIGQIHNGADDNASGTAALLEILKAVASAETPSSRSILFAFWDAEEAGLLGSKHWVSHPTVPLKNVCFVINIDMLGRLRNSRLVTVGWRSAPGLRLLLATQNSTQELTLAFQPRVIADSDHYHFYAAGVPIIHFDTDKHDDYHRPSDDPDKINWEGLLTIAKFACRVVVDAANRPEFPRFRREALKESPPAWLTQQAAVAPQVRLGVGWDSDLAKRDIAQIAQITPDSAAASAGLKVGDRIIRLGAWENASFADLKTTLQIAANPVSIRVTRPGMDSPLELRAIFRGAPIRLGAGWVEDPTLPNCIAITHVVADSPADRAGIATGDVVVEMGGRPIGSSDEFKQRILDEQGPFHFRVERQGRLRDVHVELFDRPANAAEAATR